MTCIGNNAVILTLSRQRRIKFTIGSSMLLKFESVRNIYKSQVCLLNHSYNLLDLVTICDLHKSVTIEHFNGKGDLMKGIIPNHLVAMASRCLSVNYRS